MEIKKPEWWRKMELEEVNGSVLIFLRLEAVLPEPGLSGTAKNGLQRSSGSFGMGWSGRSGI